MGISAIISIIVGGIFFIVMIAIWLFIMRLISRAFRRTSANPAQPTTFSPAPYHRSDPSSPYARIPHLLTAAEGDFFAVLQAAAPTDILIFAQVRLANLVQVKQSARRDKSHWWRIQAKCVDFVLCEPRTFIPRLVIELDDRSHDRADRQERDTFVDSVLAAAAIPILHIRWQRHYDVSALAAQIAGKLGIVVYPPIATDFPELAPAAPERFGYASDHASIPALATPVTPMRRACGVCQADVRKDAKFCSSCGATFAFL
jgi:very-short-patch-repair endonuclease